MLDPKQDVEYVPPPQLPENSPLLAEELLPFRPAMEIPRAAYVRLGSARCVAQRILMLHEGKIYASGTPDEIFQSNDPIIHRFVNGISDPKKHGF
jgi:hypothetical protein